MANSLSTPPAPNPNPQDQAAPAQNAAPAQIPAPTHEQTVAALRHFQAINKELRGLLLNPDLGKADIRSAVIDAVTRLVAGRIIPPEQAVTELAKFPDRPFDQKQALSQMLAQNMAGEIAVLEHHGQTNPPQSEDFGAENAMNSSDPDNHMQTMQGMMQSHYAGKAA